MERAKRFRKLKGYPQPVWFTAVLSGEERTPATVAAAGVFKIFR